MKLLKINHLYKINNDDNIIKYTIIINLIYLKRY